MISRGWVGRCVALFIVVSVGAPLFAVDAAHAQTPKRIGTRAAHVTGRLVGSEIRPLPFAASHVAVYWKGHPDAVVRVAFSRDGVRFGRAVDAGRDELGEQRGDGTTYGAVLVAPRALAVRVTSNERLQKLTVLGVVDRVRRVVAKVVPRDPPGPVGTDTPRPAIVARADWGADESLRFTNGAETWPPAFTPVQKLVVHHTDTANNDPNPAATVRAIYHYHAITQRWGDIGYNFLIDAAGRIYKGRNSHLAGTDRDTIDGENASGEIVTGAHARSYNAGSVGVALLGALTERDATPAARHALEDLLAWEARRHKIDPHGTSTYTNPTDGAQRVFADIAGHRDVGETQCPGGAFYATLPALRDAVAARVSQKRSAAG